MRIFVEILLLLFYLFAPTKIVLTGDEIDEPALDKDKNPESVILISNHQTYADWYYHLESNCLLK